MLSSPTILCWTTFIATLDQKQEWALGLTSWFYNF